MFSSGLMYSIIISEISKFPPKFISFSRSCAALFFPISHVSVFFAISRPIPQFLPSSKVDYEVYGHNLLESKANVKCKSLPEGGGDAQALSALDAWKHSDFLCRNYVLNGLVDSLYNVYCVTKTAKELWD
ncbi:hypothetical protein LXL04_016350 [Taraxacum kok-saghyz]